MPRKQNSVDVFQKRRVKSIYAAPTFPRASSPPQAVSAPSSRPRALHTELTCMWEGCLHVWVCTFLHTNGGKLVTVV